jgi:hypothetical protein
LDPIYLESFIPQRDFFKDAAYHQYFSKYIYIWTRALEGGPKRSYYGVTDQPGLPFAQLTLCGRPSDNHTGYIGSWIYVEETGKRIYEMGAADKFWENWMIDTGPRGRNHDWNRTNQSRQQIQIPGIHSGSHRCNYLRNIENNKRGKKSDWHVNSVLWSKTILHKTKELMYQALVQSILPYGAETWILNTQQANKLLATEMDFWRRSTRKSGKEKLWKGTIRAIMEVGKNIL